MASSSLSDSPSPLLGHVQGSREAILVWPMAGTDSQEGPTLDDLVQRPALQARSACTAEKKPSIVASHGAVSLTATP